MKIEQPIDKVAASQNQAASKLPPSMVKNTKKQPLWNQIKENKIAYFMLAPVILGFFVFTIYPNIWVIVLSFTHYNGVNNPQFTGLDNYIRLFTRDPLWWKAVTNTIIFTLGKLLIEIPLALFCAILLNNAKRKGSRFFKSVFFLPNVVSIAIMCTVFSVLLMPVNGYINGLLPSLGMKQIDFVGSSPAAMLTVMGVSIWQNFGLNMILFLAGLQGIPGEVYESAEMDGAVGFTRFFKITLPMLSRMFQVILMLAIIGSLQVFDIQWLLTAGGPSDSTEVMMTYLFKYYFPPSFSQNAIPQMGYGSALGVVASIIIGIVTVIYLYTSKKMDDVY
ncbi:carbohydrate ABC transporter permease [Neobacillus sp. NPDC093127]|uniref:carbohydrate ABC transporter permease n=1 Tax=Neobacillus sp. NPDC093127 TaxID=3364296 RepID=UPI00381479B1